MDVLMREVRAVQREMSDWYLRVSATTPTFRAAFEDVMHGLDVYRLNKRMMSPMMMQRLAESVVLLERSLYSIQAATVAESKA